MTTLLETGGLPVEELARLAWREGIRPRPIYQAHKWFARRFGSAFRALLTAAALPPDGDFWAAYYAGPDWRGRTVLDPFVGGGTAVVEALRLGADVVGVDVDAVACAVTCFETRAAAMPDVLPALGALKGAVGARLAPYYQTTGADGQPAQVLHYFWVQRVACGGCGRSVDAHPHHQLAYEAEGTRQWAFCAACHAVQALPRAATHLRCAPCGAATEIGRGPVRFGRLTCPGCWQRERLIDAAARTGRPPEWRLFAVELLEEQPARRALPLARRAFRAATGADQDVFESAAAALAARSDAAGTIAGVPDAAIPRGDWSDDRLPRYGYTRYRELFNARQLLHISYLAEAIAGWTGPEREALALAFSDHLATNCLMTSYAFGWRRAVPLFAVRAYRHIPRPVEINPWLDGTGRGTFPNAVRQVQRAIAFARAPREPLLAGGFRPAPSRWARGGEDTSPPVFEPLTHQRVRGEGKGVQTGGGTLKVSAQLLSASWRRESSDYLPLPAQEEEGSWLRGRRLSPSAGPSVRILNQDAQSLRGIAAGSVDLVLTDPPYFDNVAYGELSSFFLPWLQQFGLIPAVGESAGGGDGNLAARSRDAAAAAAFETALGRCFAEIARVLRPEGRLVFTYQHRLAVAWAALAGALAGAGLRPVQVFPLLGDSPSSLHTHAGTSKWDAVFVAVRGPRRGARPDDHCEEASGRRGAPPDARREPAPGQRGAETDDRGGAALARGGARTDDGGELTAGERPPAPRVTPAALAAARQHCACWADRLEALRPPIFRAADRRSLYRACLVAAALGCFDPPGGSDGAAGAVLLDALQDDEPPGASAGRE